MTAKLGFGERIKQVIRARAAELQRDYGNKEFGEEIGIASRGKPYSPQAVTEWIGERSEPNIRAFRAIAALTGRSIPWLMASEDLEAAVQTAERTETGLQPSPKTRGNRRPPGAGDLDKVRKRPA